MAYSPAGWIPKGEPAAATASHTRSPPGRSTHSSKPSSPVNPCRATVTGTPSITAARNVENLRSAQPSPVTASRTSRDRGPCRARIP